MNYLVGDFIIRIKNAILARRREVILPYSKINKEIGRVLLQEGFLKSCQEEIIEKKKVIVAKITYAKKKVQFNEALIVSKPSLRVYLGVDKIAKRERRQVSTLILSTSQGVMTGKEARQKGVGGEFLFEIW